MDMQAAAMAMLLKDRKEQAKAGRREYIALASRTCATVYDAAYGEAFATTPRVKREALEDRACGPARKLTSKKNRAERRAARGE